MNKGIYTIEKNINIARDTCLMVLSGDTSALTAPGQFINIALDSHYLRRPISVCDYSDSDITIIYKIVGEGTDQMSTMKENETLDVLVGLGNGFDTSKSGDKPVLIGGGVGLPPMYKLCKKLLAEGKKPSVIMGFASECDVFFKEEFKALGVAVTVCTMDGSCGICGFVTTALKDKTDYTYYYTCGPEAMLKAVYDTAKTEGQLSFEERMGCGFGACMGCSCETKYGSKRICRDGPVLLSKEVIW